MATQIAVDEVLSLDVAKQTRAPGIRFINRKGVEGVVLEAKDERGYQLARFKCQVAECSEEHERGVCDWHWVSKCRTHSSLECGNATGGSCRSNEGASPARVNI